MNYLGNLNIENSALSLDDFKFEIADGSPQILYVFHQFHCYEHGMYVHRDCVGRQRKYVLYHLGNEYAPHPCLLYAL